MNRHTIYLYGLILAVVLVACDSTTVYFHYEQPTVNGWERNDTLLFDVPAMDADGNFQSELCLRINNDYPYMNLALITEETIMPSMQTWSDTLHCKLISYNGQTLGDGVGQHQYIFPLRHNHFRQGDSLHITVRHYMKREILPGVTDLGIRIRRE